MTGLEKIIGQIKEESNAAAAGLIEKAEEEANQILRETELQAAEECDRIMKNSSANVADRMARAKSAADLQKRKAILSEKQRLIGEVIEKAKQSLDTLPDGEYLEIIVKMVQRFALAKEGQILFSQKDLARLPEDIGPLMNAALRARGGKLTVSKETRNIGGGFVLVYGGVEENCSFAALFDSAHESLQDKVQELLFS